MKSTAGFFLSGPGLAKESESRSRKKVSAFFLHSLAIVSLACMAIAAAFSLAAGGLDGYGFLLSFSVGLLSLSSLMLILNAKRHERSVTYLLPASLILAGIGLSYGWGACFPLALLAFSLAIISADLLSGHLTAFCSTIVSILSISAMYWLQSAGITRPDLFWRYAGAHLYEVAAYAVFLFVLAIVFRISDRNRIDRVAGDNTGEMPDAVVMHDAMNYLTALLLNLKMAKEKNPIQRDAAIHYLDQALRASEKMAGCMSDMRRIREGNLAIKGKGLSARHQPKSSIEFGKRSV